MTEVLLKVQSLAVNYGVIRAVTEVTFDIYRGEIVTLIGANGAGKSTTLKAIMGLLPIKSGTIEWRGEPLSKYPPWERSKMGLSLSPEGRGVFSDFSVLDNLKMGAYSRNDSAECAKDLEKMILLFPRLGERSRQLAGTLSGGEQQMLAIARALMARPQLLILDEPSLGIAPIIAKSIFEKLKELNQEGMTMLLVEQNAQMALRLAHRAFCLESGKTTLSGSAQDLLKSPMVRSTYLGESLESVK